MAPSELLLGRLLLFLVFISQLPVRWKGFLFCLCFNISLLWYISNFMDGLDGSFFLLYDRSLFLLNNGSLFFLNNGSLFLLNNGRLCILLSNVIEFYSIFEDDGLKL